MKRHLNTLYITTQGAWLSKDGQNVVVSAEGNEIGRVPVHTIGAIVAFGRVLISPPLMGACGADGISITHLDENGRFLARVLGPVSGNVLLRRTQYRWADDAQKRDAIVRSIVIGKTLNQRTVLARALRDHGASMTEDTRSELSGAIERLTHIARRTELTAEADTDKLRGFEGDGARIYFSVFDNLVRGDKPFFRFAGRNRRPPRDAVNAMLSFTYALLATDVRAALESIGLDPAVGYLHADRPGRPSLALDLMEEFRPFFADRLVLSLINRRQLTEKDFRQMENGAVMLSDDRRKTMLIAYQERKRDEILHPFLEEKVTVGLTWHVQAQLLARHLRGDLDGYPPFVWK